MSRGLGERQRKILRLLARCPQGETTQWLWEACGDFTVTQYDSGRTSVRRALASLRRRELVTANYHPRQRGQPRVWHITAAGRAEAS